MESSRITKIITVLLTSVMILLFTNASPERAGFVTSGDTSPVAGLPVREVASVSGTDLFNEDIFLTLHKKAKGLFSPRWDNSDKILQVLSVIYNSAAEGLDPDDYHINDIERLAETIIYSGQIGYDDISTIEKLLDDAFRRLSTHLGKGRVDPSVADPQWNAQGRNTDKDWASFIENTLNADDPVRAIQRLTPRHPEYVNQKKALADYRRIESEGGWGTFTTGLKKIEKGIRHRDVTLLRKRLAVTQGPVEFDPEEEELYDQALHEQVILFQERNGLEADGVVGRSTIEALNISVSERISTIEANLERWRWVSDDLGDRYIMVNTAGYILRMYENGQQAYTSKAIVGTSKRQTPVFSSVMKYIVVNPDWTVPPQILKQDVIPDLLRDSSYLQKKNMKILTADGSVVDPSTIDWKKVSPSRFPYMIRQEPGKSNPLGRIKFMFPNYYDVYIHDTPSHWQFSRNVRPFSSGCVRINNVRDFALYLLKDDSEWINGRLDEELENGRTRTIILKNPIPVHILYLTAWTDDKGTIYFGKDIYNRDKQLIRTLKKENY
jgi:murein L,D-transpeptidase YcbB/YkuD